MNKYSSSLPKLYQYPNWELPAKNVVLSHSLLSLSGCTKLIEEKQLTIPHLVGLARQDAHYVLLDETFYKLLIDEHYQLCDYHSLENIEKRNEEKKLRTERLNKAIELNDDEMIEMIENNEILREAKEFEMEEDKNKCDQRNLELKNNLFPRIEELNHGDILQFRNERLQFSFYIYQAKKGTFVQLLKKFKQYVEEIIDQNGIINENDQSIGISKLSTITDYELILIPSIEPDGYGNSIFIQ